MHRMKKPRMLTLLTLLLVVVAGMFAIRKCSHPVENKPLFPPAGSLPPKSGGDTIDVAIEISPLSFTLSSDTASGLDYELLKAIAEENGLKVKFHPFAPLDWAMTGLENGNFDLLISSLQSTSLLKKELPLTTSVYIDRQVLVQNKDFGRLINSPEELGGDTVWIAKGSPVAQRIKNLAGEIGDTIYIDDSAALTAEHLVMLTASGKIPRCVVSKGIADKMGQSHPNLNVSTPVSFNQFQVWAVSPKNLKLKDRLDGQIENFKKTPKYKTIINKYLGTENMMEN